MEFICYTTNDTEPEVVSESRLNDSVKRLDLSSAYVHGACIVFVDGLVTSGHLVLCIILLLLTSGLNAAVNHCCLLRL